MSKTTVPSMTDVLRILGNLSTPVALPSGFADTDAPNILASAIVEWGMRTRYKPFFQTSASTLYQNFDPPGPMTSGIERGGGDILRLKNGLLVCTNVWRNVDQTIGVAGGSGTLLTPNLDYYLGPSNASTVAPFPAPWTEIQFTYPQYGTPQSIVVQGIWGYCQTNIPDDAWQAQLNLACASILEKFADSMRTNIGTLRDDDQSKTYDPRMLDGLGEGFRRESLKTLRRYTLMV